MLMVVTSFLTFQKISQFDQWTEAIQELEF